MNHEAGSGPRPPNGAIDVHAHVADAEAADEMSQILPAFVPRFRRLDDENWSCTFPDGTTRPVPAGLLDTAIRLAAMARQGISMQALSCSTWLYLYAAPAVEASAAIRIQNDAFCRIARAEPDHFVALIGLPMQDPELALAEIERMASRPEVAGIAIATNINGMNLDDDALGPVWAAAAERDLPILVHPYPEQIAGRERLGAFHLANLIGNPLESTIAIASVACSGILERNPALRFGFVHGGGFAPYQLGRWDHGWLVRPETRASIDRPPSAYVERCYFDALTHDPRSTAFLWQRFGTDRVLIGTDYPWDMSVERPLDELVAAGLPSDVVLDIATTTARTFLRLPTS